MKADRKNIVVICVAAFLIAIILFVSLNIDDWIKKDSYLGEDQRIVELGGKKYIPKSLDIILVFGLDTDGELKANDSYYNTEQADFLAVIAIDKTNKTYSVLQINRDTMVQIDELSVTGARLGSLKTQQIALAHTYGDGGTSSCTNTVRAVSRFLYDIDIDNYVALSMGAVQKLNDFIGGVEVEIPADYTVLDASFVSGAKLNLMGEQAIKFVRARSNVDDGTNIARMERQKIYMDAFIAKLKTLNIDTDFVTDAYKCVSEENYIMTDSSVDNLFGFIDGISEYNCLGIFTPDGTATVKDTYMEFTPDSESLIKLVTDLYYEEY